MVSEAVGIRTSRQKGALTPRACGLWLPANDCRVHPRPTEGAGHAYHLYVARHARADELAEHLGREGVSARGYYRTPVHRQPAMAEFGARAELPGTDELAATNLALPMGTGLDPEAVGEVVDACASGST